MVSEERKIIITDIDVHPAFCVTVIKLPSFLREVILAHVNS